MVSRPGASFCTLSKGGDVLQSFEHPAHTAPAQSRGGAPALAFTSGPCAAGKLAHVLLLLMCWEGSACAASERWHTQDLQLLVLQLPIPVGLACT